MPEKADTLITHAHTFTMQGTGVGYIPDGAVAIRDRRIAAVGDTAALTEQYKPEEIIDASDCALLPGLIDAHMHTPWAVVRGVAQDVSNWMQNSVFAGLAPANEI